MNWNEFLTLLANKSIIKKVTTFLFQEILEILQDSGRQVKLQDIITQKIISTLISLDNQTKMETKDSLKLHQMTVISLQIINYL